MPRLILVSSGGQRVLSGCWYLCILPKYSWIRFRRGRLADGSQWPYYTITPASLLLSCCFVFVKLLAVNKFTTWWAWFIGLKWMRGNSGYLSEPENLCTIGLYRSVQLQRFYDVCLADTRCVLGVIYHNAE